ncbi:NERD domain-containing protein [Sulfurimonas sp. NW7]|uniref:NERD domain-containing protein n=1 Tax=Sulfurimonas sp. NW7 TaxID=2922727 RepID=UPI003DA85967
MILKEFDSKPKSIKALKLLLNQSTSEKQKILIKQDLLALKNGYEAEKQNAYYIDFYLKDSKHIIVLHDLRIEYNGESAQIDHMLITRFGIELIESKSFSGEVTINDDNSINVKYNNKIKSFPNPIEQSKRHAKLLGDFINNNFDIGKRIKVLGGFPILSNAVLLNPNTYITNKTLPKKFYRADSYINTRRDEIDNISTLQAFKSASKMVTIEKAQELAKFLIAHHSPVVFEYEKKYKIAKPKENIQKEAIDIIIEKDSDSKKTEKLSVGSSCPFCNQPLVLRNANKNTPFLGCSTYPKCHFTRRITKKDAQLILNGFC